MRTIVPVSLAVAGLLLGTACGLSAAPVDSKGRTLPGAGSEPESPQGKEHRAGVQAMVKGDLGAAKKHFEASLKIHARYAPAIVGLAAVAQLQGSPAQAETYLQQAEKLAPDAPEVKLARGRFQIARGDLAGAEVALKSAVALGKDRIPPLIELGDLYLRLPDRKADALSAYRQAAAVNARNPAVQYGLGAAAAASGLRDEAFAAFDRASALRPGDAAPLRAAGRLHMEAGAYGKALEAFDAGLARQPKFVPLILDRSDALASAGRWSDSIQALRSAEALAPTSVEVQVKLGDAYQGARNWSDAEAQYLKAIALAPSHPIAYNNLAWMTVERKGNARNAVEWARQAVALSPNSSPFHDTLGWAERADGNLPAAIASLKRAVELEPRVAGHHYRLGVVQSEARQPVAARAALLKSLELDPRMPDAARAQQLLHSLPPPT